MKVDGMSTWTFYRLPTHLTWTNVDIYWPPTHPILSTYLLNDPKCRNAVEIINVLHIDFMLKTQYSQCVERNLNKIIININDLLNWLSYPAGRFYTLQCRISCKKYYFLKLTLSPCEDLVNVFSFWSNFSQRTVNPLKQISNCVVKIYCWNFCIQRLFFIKSQNNYF